MMLSTKAETPKKGAGLEETAPAADAPPVLTSPAAPLKSPEQLWLETHANPKDADRTRKLKTIKVCGPKIPLFVFFKDILS